MAQLIGELQIIGSLQNLSAYKMRGSNKIIVRKKGGPSKNKVRHSPTFEKTRMNNKEFGGRSKAASHIKRLLWPLLSLADYNITGPLNALLKPIQEMDKESDWGQRNILISKNPRLLEGFPLNRRYLLESIVRTPFAWSIQKEQLTVDIPDLLPGINFIVPGNYSWYQIIAVAGQVPDLFYNKYRYKPQDQHDYFDVTETEWLPVNSAAPAGKLVIQKLPEKTDTSSFMVAVGIAFGNMQYGHIERVKYVGAAKVIGMV
jgi:hypothetical protein